MKQGQGRNSKDKSKKEENADCVEQRYNYLKQHQPWSPAVEKAATRKRGKLSQLAMFNFTLIYLRENAYGEKKMGVCGRHWEEASFITLMTAQQNQF